MMKKCFMVLLAFFVLSSFNFMGLSEDFPKPLIWWKAEAPAGTVPGAPIYIADFKVNNSQAVNGFKDIKLMPSEMPRYQNFAKPFWSKTDLKEDAVGLASWKDGSVKGSVLQCGEAKTIKPVSLKDFTLYIKFKIVGNMQSGGASPGFELDGYLMQLPPSIAVFIEGRGDSGKDRRLPRLVIKKQGRDACEWLPNVKTELQQGTWYNLTINYQAAKTAKDSPVVKMWLDGKECPVKVGAKNHLFDPSAELEVNKPILIGGNRGWSNCPIELQSFAVYNKALPTKESASLTSKDLPYIFGSKFVAEERPVYEILPRVNSPEAWKLSDENIVLRTVPPEILEMEFSSLKKDKSYNFYLKKPVKLDGKVKSVDVWACLPSGSHEQRLTIYAIFEDADGKEILNTGNNQNFKWGNNFLGGHIGYPNSRISGLWRHLFCDIPREQGAVRFAGLSILNTYDSKKSCKFYLKDLALERIDYLNTPLYYVVGNYRDNFACTGFNGCGARALTAESGDSKLPYVLMDNLVDQTKIGRPARINLQVSVYDENDRLVYDEWFKDLKSETAPDSFLKILIPITQAGTYRVKGKSYNAKDNSYFTTDWCKLVIVKGDKLKPLSWWSSLFSSRKDGQLPLEESQEILSVNREKPFGRLEKDDEKEIVFNIKPSNGKALELRYAVIPYSEWVPSRSSKRQVKLDHKIAVNGDKISVPYEKKRSVELVVAELWDGDKCIDREERLIGINNELDKAKSASAIVTQDSKEYDWINLQFHNIAMDNMYKFLEANLDEARTFTPYQGIHLDMERLQPIPGVYDWDWVKPLFELAAKKKCQLVLYLTQKYPFEWGPVEFFMNEDGAVHKSSVMWGYMIGRIAYFNGKHSPELMKKANVQMARHLAGEPGFGGYYFESEHIATRWFDPLTESHDSGNMGKFHKFLKEKYKTIDELNKVYGTFYDSFDMVKAPEVRNKVLFSRKIMFADWREYQNRQVINFIGNIQFDTVQKIDPDHRFVMYGFSDDYKTLKKIADNGGIMANGGIHSDYYTDAYYESYNSVPGLRCRMEPHGMWSYNPKQEKCKNGHKRSGFDEMIFGMLAMGGRGLNYQIFLPGRKVEYEKMLKTGYGGLDEVYFHLPVCRELQPAEKLHDEIGLMALRSKDYLGGGYEPVLRNIHRAVYARNHWSPKTLRQGGNIDYLNGSKVIFITGSAIDAQRLDYLKKFLEQGGCVVMENINSGRFSLEKPDTQTANFFLNSMGIDFFSDGKKLKNIPWEHDVYQVGKGKILLPRRFLHPDQWQQIIPTITEWAGITVKLADVDDPQMQIHVLKKGKTFYLVVTHRSIDPKDATEWQGSIRFLKSLPDGKYKVTEIWNGDGELGEFTPKQLANGIPAGKFKNWQMKILKITPL